MRSLLRQLATAATSLPGVVREKMAAAAIGPAKMRSLPPRELAAEDEHRHFMACANAAIIIAQAKGARTPS